MARADDPIERLTALRTHYAAALPARMDAMTEACSRLEQGWGADDRETALRLAHQLNGAGKSFGFAQMGSAARDLEEFLLLLPPEIEPVPALRERLISLAEAVRLAADHPDEAAPQEVFTDRRSPWQAGISRAPLIYVVDVDAEAAKQLSRQIGLFGYRVDFLTSLSDLEISLHAEAPAALVLDVRYLEAVPGASALLNVWGRTPKIIVTSAETDFDLRLAAVKSGADGFFGKPVAVGPMVELLDRLTERRSPEPYRVLIMDDEAAVAEYHALTLQRNGFSAWVVTEPTLLLSALEEFRPDLILMDLHLPGCTGIELSEVIRHDTRFTGVPIVFLSAETDLERHFAALSHGADAFLVKPIPPAQLVPAVLNRCERARVMSALMTHDGLTDLLNHTAVYERLAYEIARLQRQQSAGATLVFAMLDIDHFKNVNDKYGHAAGDLVLKTLGRFFKEYLRKTDVAGRCGGEEFAVILPATNGTGGLTAIEDLRTGFAKIQHQAEDSTFSVTLSAGLVLTDGFRSASDVRAAADAALYAAKRAGRNRTIVSSPLSPPEYPATTPAVALRG